MDSHLFYLIVSDCIIYCLHQQKTYTTAIGKISNRLACRHKMERTVLFQLLSKLLKLSIYIYKNNIMWVSFLIFPGNLQICGSCRKTSLFPVNLYFVHLLFHIYRLLSALRRFDKSVCFLPAPKHLTSKPRMAAGSLLSGSLPLEISPGKNVPYLQ